MSAWSETGRPVAEFWALTLREVALVLESHRAARDYDLELANFTAFRGEAYHRMDRLKYEPVRAKSDDVAQVEKMVKQFVFTFGLEAVADG